MSDRVPVGHYRNHEDGTFSLGYYRPSKAAIVRTLGELCQSKCLNSFTADELADLLSAIGIVIPGWKPEVAELFVGRSPTKTRDEIVDLFGSAFATSEDITSHTGASKPLHETDIVLCCVKADDHTRVIKALECDWFGDSLLENIQEAVIQAYLAHRFPGKVPAVHRVYMGNYQVIDPRTRRLRWVTGRFVIEMEYIQGDSLENLLHRGALTQVELYKALRDVFELLNQLQLATGFVHNDLHHGNICQRADGSWALIDYGHSLFYDGMAEPELAVIGGFEAWLHIPRDPPPGDLGDLARSGWVEMVGRYNLRAFDDPNHSSTSRTPPERYYAPCSTALGNPGENPHVWSGDLFYFIFRVTQNLKRRAGFDETYQALRKLYQVDQINLFDVLVELDRCDRLEYITYFASKEPKLLAAVFPGLFEEQVSVVLNRFRPGKALRALRVVCKKVTGKYSL